MTDGSKLERVTQARLRLRERYMSRHGRQADAGAPQGSGPVNRHGMPKLPVGQTETRKWPVLDLGEQPRIEAADWTLRLDGACENPLLLTWQDFMRLPQAEDVSDFHCVTTWSKFDMRWRGVRFADLAELAACREDARHVMFHAFDGYTTNVSLDDAMAPDVLLVHTWEGAPLPREHGGPVRVITPRLYAWKGAKWVSRIEFMRVDSPGFWEQRGYSNSADPWADDRYS
ncbi:MAG: sulfite oxidase-like oxidoreductase [Gammaproteobacteria bacterium]